LSNALAINTQIKITKMLYLLKNANTFAS